MSSSTLLGLGSRAMFASYAALQTTGHNIANANTVGYSRQQVELETVQGQFTGAGYFGRGVDVTSVTRSHDAFLTREALTSRALASSDEARSSMLQRLEKLFPTGDAGLGAAAGELLNAFVDVASKPQDLSARQVVMARADELAAAFRSASDGLDGLQSDLVQDLRNSVAAVNSLATQIASVNNKIAQASGSGQPPNDLLDQRDKLIGQLADYVQVNTIVADDGSLNVFMAGGQRLVLGGEATVLSVVPDQFDPAKAHAAVDDGNGVRILPDDRLGGGSISGLLRFQSNDLVEGRNRLGQLATAVALRLNQQQSFGLDLRQPASAGAALFSIGAPQTLVSENNTKVSGSFVGGVTLSVVDSTQIQASDYDLRPDPSVANTYQLTRLSDGNVTTISGTSAVVDGLQINISGPPAAGDRFLLRPVAGAMGTMRRVLDDPRGLAAATPVVATLGSTNTGTATVGSLSVVSATFDPTRKVDIAFTSNAGNYTYTLRDATTNAVISSATGTWTAGQPISLNGWDLMLNGVPKNGDTIGVDNNPRPASSNGNALAMTALRDQSLVGRRTSPSTFVGETITDAYASAIAEMGVRVQGAKAAADTSQSVATEAESARSGRAGVNLDEEAARLMQYQQSYQAAAKMLQVAQTVFDTLLQTAAR